MKTGIEYIANQGEVIRIDYDCLDPNGYPTITVLSAKEVEELGLNNENN